MNINSSVVVMVLLVVFIPPVDCSYEVVVVDLVEVEDAEEDDEEELRTETVEGILPLAV